MYKEMHEYGCKDILFKVFNLQDPVCHTLEFQKIYYLK